MILPIDISPTDREQLMDDLRDALTSDKSLPMARETDWEERLDQEITDAKSEIEARPNGALGWMRYTHAAALKRSVQYAGAGRGTLLAHGVSNEFREIYEGSRQADDANIV